MYCACQKCFPPAPEVYGAVFSVHTETGVVGDVAVVGIERGRGRPRKEKPPKEKRPAGRPRHLREPVAH